MKTEHILVIRFSAMGDVAMTVPVILFFGQTVSARKDYCAQSSVCPSFLRRLSS